MPINGYSVGRDFTLVVQTSTGPLALNKLTGFEPKMDTTEIKIKRLDGITDHVRFPDGWSGTFEVERADSRVDDYFCQIEADYYAGINEQPCQIYESVDEPNGGVSQYRYEGVLLSLDDAGKRGGDASIKQRIKWKGSRKVKVA